jgi:hypothetical protein
VVSVVYDTARGTNTMTDEQQILAVLTRIERKLNEVDARLKAVEVEVKRVKNEARSRA